MTMTTTIEQRRAADALKRVKDLEGKPQEFKTLYRAYVDRIGPAVIMNGLGQALATERAAAGSKPNNEREKAHHQLYQNLQSWLCHKSDGVYASEADAADLLHAIMNKDELHYLRAQAEALAWLEWHKKCCRALLPKGEGNDE